MSYTTEIAALREKLKQDKIGVIPAGKAVPLNVAENLVVATGTNAIFRFVAKDSGNTLSVSRIL